MNDYVMIARVYALVAEMEAIKAGIEQTKHLPLLLDIDKAQKFHEAEQQILGIANELAVLGRG